MAVGRDQVPGRLPNTCWVSRSSSRNGSVRISIAGHSFHGRRQGGDACRTVVDRSDISNDSYSFLAAQWLRLMSRVRQAIVGAGRRLGKQWLQDLRWGLTSRRGPGVSMTVTAGGTVAGLATTACVRVRDASGGVVGSGFLVGTDLVATCAHVVATAARADPYAPETPTAPVTIDLPTVHGGTPHRSARVHRMT